MIASGLISAARTAGVAVRLDGERLILSASTRPDLELLEQLRLEKTAIVDYLSGLGAWTEEDWRALFDERAGIMEFDGGLSRTEAEARALKEVEELRQLVIEQHA